MKKDFTWLAIVFAAMLAAFAAAFHGQSIYTVLSVVFSIFWLFIIPGFVITYLISLELDTAERIFMGFGIGAAFLGVFSYYSGILGLDIKWHYIVLPVAIIAVASFMVYRKIGK